MLKKVSFKFPVAEISQRTGYSKGSVSQILQEKRSPTDEFLEKFAKEFNIEFEITNQVNESPETYKKSEAINISFSEMNIMFVPIVSSYAYAGYLNGFGDHEYLDELPKIAWADDKEHRGEYLCFEVRGDSMDDGTTESIMENDIILCRNVKQDFWKSKLHISKWDFVIVHKEKGILVKRIIKHDVDNGTLTLHSLNDYYEDFEIHLKDVAKILNVVDLKRKHKRR